MQNTKNRIIVCMMLSIFLLSIVPATVSAASYSYEWDEETKTATIVKHGLFGSNPVLGIKQISVKQGLTTFEEVLEIASYVDYTLTSSDLKWLWTKHKGDNNIHLSELQKLTTESYVVTVSDYGDVEHSQAVPNVISYTNVTDAWNANSWELDLGVGDSKEKWNITYYSVANASNITGTVGFDRYEVITANPLKIKIFWSEYKQTGTHEETKYRDVFKFFSPVGKTIHNGQTYTIKITLHKKAELGEFSIHLTPDIAGIKINELTWWNHSWLYKTESVLTDVPSGGYQYNLTVHSSVGTNNQTDVFLNGHNATNFSDIRFVLDDATELAYWIEDNSTDPIEVWVNVTGNGIVGLYYGSDGVSSASNGTNTFLFFDDAEIDPDGTNMGDSSYNPWYNTVGGVFQYTVASKLYGNQGMYLYSGGGNEGNIVLDNDSTNPWIGYGDWILETWWKPTTGNDFTGLYFGSAAIISGYHAYTGGATQFQYINNVPAWVAAGAYSNQWYELKIVCKHDAPQDTNIYIDGSEITIGNTADCVGTDHKWKAYGAVGGRMGYLDNYRIRKYASPEPSWATWSEQQYAPQKEGIDSIRKLTRTSEGYLHTVYTKFDGSNYRIYYGKSMDNGNNWVGMILTDAGINNTCPSIAGDSEDNLWVVYSREGSGIRYRKYTGLSWRTEQTISSDSGEVPVITVDSADNIHASWMANLSSTYQIRYWNETNTTNVTSGGNESKNPSLVVDSNNYLHIAYQKWNATSDTANIKYQKYTDSWQSVYNVTSGETHSQQYPCIAVDLSDYVHITWQTTDKKIKYKKYTASWQATEEVCDGGIYEQYDPSISVYSTNYVYVTWFGLTAGYPNNYIIREKHWSGSWSGISDILHPAGKNVTYPNSISALYPKICGDCYLNIPLTGFSFVYDEEGTVKYYSTSTWRCGDQYVLTIKARDTETNQYITNFTVDFSSGETKSTDSGVVRYTCLDSGYYEITVSSNEYHSAQQSIVLDQNKEIIVYLTPITETEYFLPQKKLVEFRVQNVLGKPYPDALVTTQGYSTTMGDWDWLLSFFGWGNKSLAEGYTMSGTTDDNGQLSFMMVETIKYQINVSDTESPARFNNKTFWVYPKDERYNLVVGDIIKWQKAGTEEQKEMSINVTASTNDTHAFINVSYNDPSNHTTYLAFYLNHTVDNNVEECLQSANWSNTSVKNHSFVLSEYLGRAFKIQVVTEHEEWGNRTWTYAKRFEGMLIDLGLPDAAYPMIAIAILLFLGGVFGRSSATQGSLVICFGGWFFWAIGFLTLIPNTIILPAISLATIVSIIALMSEKGKREGVQ